MEANGFILFARFTVFFLSKDSPIGYGYLEIEQLEEYQVDPVVWLRCFINKVETMFV